MPCTQPSTRACTESGYDERYSLSMPGSITFPVRTNALFGERREVTWDLTSQFPLSGQATGVLWTQMSNFDTTVTNGLAEWRDLAAHHTSGRFRDPARNVFEFLDVSSLLIMPVPLIDICPDCPLVARAFPAAQLVTDGIAVHARVDGGEVDITAAFGDRARFELANPDRRWMAPAEPAFWIEDDFPPLMAVDARGQDIASVLVYDRGRIRDTREKEPPQSPTSAGIDPPPRVDFGAVLSGFAPTRGAYIVGGIAPDGTPRDDVWRYVPRTGEWLGLRSESHIPIGRVLAATIRPEERSLYVIERGLSPSARPRLLRIDAQTGERSVVSFAAPFTARGLHDELRAACDHEAARRRGMSFPSALDTFRIAPSPDGRLLIVAAHAPSERWLLAAARVEGISLRVDALAAGTGVPTGALRADGVGISFATSLRRGSPRVVGVRWEQLVHLTLPRR